MKKSILGLILILFISTSYSVAWDINNAVLESGFDLNISANTSSSSKITGIWLEENGSKLFTSVWGGNITQWDLSTDWDVNTLTWNNSESGFSTSHAYTETGNDVNLNPAGTIVVDSYTYIHTIDRFGISIGSDTLAVPFNITTDSPLGSWSYHLLWGSSFWGSYIEPSGEYGFQLIDANTIDNTPGQRYLSSYRMEGAWNVTSHLNTTTSTLLRSYDSKMKDIYVTDDGTQLFAIGNTNQKVYSFTMSDPFNISTLNYDSSDYYLGYDALALFFNPTGTKMYVLRNTGVIYEYTLSEEEAGEEDEALYINYIRFYADWNFDSVYNSSYSDEYEIKDPYGTVLEEDLLLEDLRITIKAVGGITLGTYTADSYGKIYPTELIDGYSYNLIVNYLNYNYSVTFVYNADGMNYALRPVVWAVSTNLFGGGVTDATVTIYETDDPATNQSADTEDSTATAWFYTYADSTLDVSATANKSGYSVEEVVFLRLGLYGGDFESNGVKYLSNWGFAGIFIVNFNPASFTITDVEGNEGEVTTYGYTKTETTPYVNEPIREIHFKLYDTSTGFLTARSDFTLIKAEIIDRENDCNEEQLGEVVEINTILDYWNEFQTQLGTQDCEYKNLAILGEYLECYPPAGGYVNMPYSEYLDFTILDFDKDRVYLETPFSLSEEAGLKVLKVAGTQNTFCLSQGLTCYFDYTCTQPTTNSFSLKVQRNGIIYTLGAEYDFSAGQLSYLEPEVINTALQRFNLVAYVGSSKALNVDTTCVLDIAFDDDSEGLFTLNKQHRIIGTRLYTDLSPEGAERSNVSYDYNVTCSGGGIAETIDSGTVYVSQEDYFYSDWGVSCQILPSTISNGSNTILKCNVPTSLNDTAINITVDNDVGAGVNWVELSLDSSEWDNLLFPDLYERIYSLTTNFTSTVNGEAYDINFILNGGGYYANRTISKTLTIDDSIETTVIKEVYTNKDTYANGDDYTCGVIYTGEGGLSSATVNVYSYEYSIDSDVSDTNWLTLHSITSTLDGDELLAEQIGSDTFKLELDVNGLYNCPLDEDYTECVSSAGLVMKSEDKIICEWSFNYGTITDAVNATFTSNAQLDISTMLMNPTQLMGSVLSYLMMPVIFGFFLLILLIKLVSVKSQ